MPMKNWHVKVGGYISDQAISAPMDPLLEIQIQGRGLYLPVLAPADAVTTATNSYKSPEEVPTAGFGPRPSSQRASD